MLMLFLLLSQYPFGQNKVQYKEYKWMTNETTHFTIYYHTGDEPLVSFGESVLESTYDFLKRDLFYRKMKKKYLLSFMAPIMNLKKPTFSLREFLNL